MSKPIALLFCVLASMTPARAGLTVSLSPSTRSGPGGIEIVFSGTLTNTSATQKVYLNGIHANLSGTAATYLTFEPNAFFANVPGILLPGETYSNSEIFRVLLSGLAPSGDYAGTVAIRGGMDIFATNNLGRASFVVSSPGKISSITRLGNGHIFLQGFGAANVTDTIEVSPDLMTMFTTLGTVTTDSDGAFQYEDTDAGNFPIRFYRLSSP
jgi:hypothetical protein